MKKYQHIESIDVQQRQGKIELIIYRPGDDGNVAYDDYLLTISDATNLIEKLLDAAEGVMDDELMQKLKR